jgi:hypothetical protein
MHIVKYSRFPNNEIRATHYYSAPPGESNKKSDRTSNVTSEPLRLPELPGEGSSDAPSYLTLGANCHSERLALPFKRTKFGLNAKRTLLRMGGAYDTLSTSPTDFVFLTGTLPGNTPAAFRGIAVHSSYIATSIGQWIKRTVNAEYYFFVWELQKRGALHFHYCAYIPDRVFKEKAIAGFKRKWTDLLDDISEREGVCLWEGSNGACHADRYGVLQAYAQEVHTSVAAYLSGYLGGSKDKHSQDKDSPYYPRRWWGASRASTSLLKSLTEEVISEHTSYREARLEMKLFYEAVSHDAPLAYHYSHTIGVGSTIVSYHPQDKGQSTWQGLQKMALYHNHHPHIASLIREVNKARTMILFYIKKLSRGQNSALKPLLYDLEDSGMWRVTPLLMLVDIQLGTLRKAKSHLPTPSPLDLHLQELLRRLTLIEEFLTLNQNHMTFNRYGWLSNLDDVPYTVDWDEGIRHSSTTGHCGSGKRGRAAHGSLSPQNSPINQLELPCFSDSQGFPHQD